MTSNNAALADTVGIHHVRLTVTDIARSKAFYVQLLGSEPAADFSDRAGDPAALADPEQLYAGCVFELGDQILGLRPVATPGDRFDSTRVGLDHVSLRVPSLDALHAAADRLAGSGIEHGEIIRLDDFGMAILSVQDPDDINLELAAALD